MTDIREGEEWRVIDEYPAYAVSSFGRVMRIKDGPTTRAGKIIKGRPDQSGRLGVSLCNDGVIRTKGISRLVCAAFNGPPPTARHHAAHNDGNCQNDIPSNLAWKTAVENEADKKLHGTAPIGESNGGSKITEGRALEIISARGTMADIGARYGMSSTQVCDIKNAKSWGYLQPEKSAALGLKKAATRGRAL